MSFDINDQAGREEGVRTVLNLESTILASKLSQITCPAHEWCNGSCVANSGIPVFAFEPLLSPGPTFEVTPPASVSFPEPSLRTEPPPTTVGGLEAFRYVPLDSSKAMIRLIRVKPAVFLGDPVIIELLDASLNSPPSYAALSYHWGPPILDHEVVCNGKLLRIAKSLHGALKRHRQQKGQLPQLLWADAICIDQTNMSEINEQLVIMNGIYYGAETVHVDLGDVGSDWYHGLDLITRIKTLWNCAKEQPDWVTEFTFENFQRYGLPPKEHAAWKLYSSLFASPWFCRTWIIQESVLARQINIRYGRFSFEWEDLEASFNFLHKYNLSTSVFDDLKLRIAKLNFFRILEIRYRFKNALWHSPQMLSPIELMRSTREFLVSNDKDKVIGVLGMLPPSKGKESFRPDYSWPVDKVYHGFATWLVWDARPVWGSYERVKMLSHAGLERRSPASNLPSWVPDWRAQSVHQFPKPLATIRNKPYAAHPLNSGPAMFLLGGEDDPECIFVAGWIGDTICSTTTGSSKFATTAQFLEWHDEAWNIFQSAAESKSLVYQDPEDAFCRTLLVDDLNTGGNAVDACSQIDDPVKCHQITIEALRSEASEVFGVVAGMGKSSNIGTFATQAMTACAVRKFAVTEKGYIGLVPNCATIGDSIYVFSGVTVPFIVRQKDTESYLLVGEAYIHGIMEREVFHGENSELFKRNPIKLH